MEVATSHIFHCFCNLPTDIQKWAIILAPDSDRIQNDLSIVSKNFIEWALLRIRSLCAPVQLFKMSPNYLLKVKNTLTSLSLSYNTVITDDTLQYLTNLTCLDLAPNRIITDKGIGYPIPVNIVESLGNTNTTNEELQD
jgi:Leucine-rich repeat (LRR) protein